MTFADAPPGVPPKPMVAAVPAARLSFQAAGLTTYRLPTWLSIEPFQIEPIWPAKSKVARQLVSVPAEVFVIFTSPLKPLPQSVVTAKASVPTLPVVVVVPVLVPPLPVVVPVVPLPAVPVPVVVLVDPVLVGVAVSGWPLRSQFVGVDGPLDPGEATNPMPTVPPTGSVAFHPALVIVYRVPTCDTTAPSQTLVRLAARSNWTVQFGTATTSLLANCTWPWNPVPQFWVTV